MTDFIPGMLNRRTVRKYSAEPVEESLLNELLMAAARCLQPEICRFIV
jgi:hypothetical protein